MCTFISSDTNLVLSRSTLKENDILVSIAGALGDFEPAKSAKFCGFGGYFLD